MAKEVTSGDMFDNLLSGILTGIKQEENMGIVDFAHNVIFNGDEGHRLFPTQCALLKAYYSEPLTEQDKSILSEWLNEDRTTWIENRRYNNLVLESGRRGSKALSLDTLIPTPSGWSLIQDIKVGDYVFNSNGKPTKVLATSPVFYDHDVYSITFCDGSIVKADEGHLWLTQTKASRKAYGRAKNPTIHPEVITTKEIEGSVNYIRLDGKVEYNHSISLTKPLLLENIDLPIHPYLLGLWLGDGNSASARITSSVEDQKEIIFKLEELGYIVNKHKEEENYWIKGLNTFLRELNLLNNKHIPEIYLRASIQQRLELLRGLMDSDGTVCSKGKTWFTNKNKNIAEGAYELAASLGARPTIHSRMSKLYGKECGIYYEVRLRPPLNPFFLYRKAIRYKSCSAQANKRFIKSVTKINSEPVKCIQVEGGMYLVGKGMIPTHNSTLCSIIALKEFYDLIILDKPAKKYNLLPSSPIAILVIAQTMAQVKETIFAAIKGYAEGSFFFQGLVKNHVIEILGEEIRCRSKNVTIYAKHTNTKALVGYTTKCLILDEAARFETNMETGENLAMQIWENVGAGGAAFGKEARKVCISSAWETNDPIEKLYTIANEKDFQTLGFRLTTFQLNLSLKKGISPPIVSAYNTDITKARLEYEGIRYSKHNTFIPKDGLEKAAIGRTCIDAQPKDIDIITGQDIRYYVGIDILRLTNADITQTSFIHVDPALKKDSAALAITSPYRFPDGKYGVQIDGLLKWEPHIDDSGLKRLVSFVDIEEKLVTLSAARNVRLISFDSWNSASLIQRLHMKGISTLEMSTSRDMQVLYYTLFRDLLSHGLIVMPKDSLWSGQAILELSELVMRPNKQIIHPYAAKDIADSVVNSVYNCFQFMTDTGMSTGLSSGISKVSSTTTLLTSSAKNKNHLIGKSIDKLRRMRK